MTWAGAFLLPDADSTLDFEWGATYSPRNVRGGGDLGGTCLVATAGTSQPELAASFLTFLTEREPMRDFCAVSSLLPTRRDLIDGGLEFDVRPDLAEVFLQQATVVESADAAQVASPSMAAINEVLSDQLERAFVGGKDTDQALNDMAEGIAEATGS